MPGPDHSERRRPGRTGWLLFAAGALAFLVLVVYLAGRYPDAIESEGDKASVLYYVLWLTVLASAFVASRRLKLGQALRQGLIWIAVALLLVLGYSFRHDLVGLKDRLVGELLPHEGIAAGEAVSFRAARDGHFHVEAVVNGRPLRFLVDTGASDIVLRPADAARLGFAPAELAFTRIYQTANGTVRGAPVRLASVDLGPFSFRDVAASVNEAAMDVSLLGVSFLERFGGYEVRDGTLTLYP